MDVLSLLLSACLFTQDKVKITVEFDEVPDVQEWAEKARDLCEKWYPVLSEALASKDFTPPREVRLVFKTRRRHRLHHGRERSPSSPTGSASIPTTSAW